MMAWDELETADETDEGATSEEEVDYSTLTDEELVAGSPPHVQETLLRWFREADEQRRTAERRRRIRDLSKSRTRRKSRPLQPGDELGTSKTLAVRLPRWVDEQLRAAFVELGVTTSQGLRQILEEWCVERLFPALEHRDATFARFAAVRDGPRVVDWLQTRRPPLDEASIEEQVQDYVELFRGRLEAVLGPNRF